MEEDITTKSQGARTPGPAIGFRHFLRLLHSLAECQRAEPMLGVSLSSQRAHFVSKAEDSGQASVRTIAHDPRTLSPASGARNHVGESTQPYSRGLGQRQPASLRKPNPSFKEYKHLQRLIVGPHWWLRAGLGVPPLGASWQGLQLGNAPHRQTSQLGVSHPSQSAVGKSGGKKERRKKEKPRKNLWSHERWDLIPIRGGVTLKPPEHREKKNAVGEDFAVSPRRKSQGEATGKLFPYTNPPKLPRKLFQFVFLDIQVGV